MLVLTRRISEAIKIGDDITVTIIDINTNQVKIGIEAPVTMKIYRKELYERIRNENKLAVKSSLDEFRKIKEILEKT